MAKRIGWNALFLENHDQARSVSTWGNDEELREKSAKCLATMYFLMQGTPFIYQGQEIGMTNVQFESIDDYDDVAIKNMHRSEREEGKSHQETMEIIWKSGRDNSRTPMQWNAKENAGFTTGKPWIKINSNYPDINVEKEISDPDSIYQYYKNLIALRKKEDALIYGSYDIVLEKHEKIYAYTRTLANKRLLIITNLFEEEADFNLPAYLKAYEAALKIGN